MLRILCYLLLLGVPAFAFGQTPKIDAGRKQLLESRSDAARLHAAFVLLEEWESYSIDSFHAYLQLADRLAQRLRDADAQNQVRYYTGAFYFQKNNMDSATRFADSNVLQMQRRSQYNDMFIRARSLQINILLRQDRLDSALAIGYEALKQAEAKADTFGLLKATLAIANVQFKLHRFDEAMKGYRQCLEWMNRHEAYKLQVPYVYNNVALVYYNVDQEDSSYCAIREGIRVATEAQNLTSLANAYILYGGISAEFKKLEQAETAFNQGIQVRKKIGDMYYVIGDMATLALFYAQSPHPEKGIALCKEGLALTKNNGQSLPNLKDLYIALAKNYKAAGNYKAYAETEEIMLRLDDSSYRKNTAEKLAEIQAKYEVQKKENIIIQQKLDLVSTNYQLASKKYQLLGALALLIAGGVFGIVFFNQYRKKQALKLALLQAEEKHLAEQAVMRAEEAERKRIAADLHDSLGAYAASINSNIERVMKDGEARPAALQELRSNSRSIVSQLADTIWVLQKEDLSLTAISDRIKIFIHQIEASYPGVTIDVEEDIDTDHVFAPAQAFHLFQVMKEAINNALRHGKGDRVLVRLAGRESWRIDIIDNGVGIGAGISTTGGGNGLGNMRKRAKQSGWEVQWLPTSPHGTNVIITANTN